MNRTAKRFRTSGSLLGMLTHQLGEQEARRRLWHFFPGMIALALATAPHRETVRLWVMVLIVTGGILIPAWAAIRYQRAYQRRVGENPIPSILGYVLPVSILCLLYRSHIEIPLTVTAIIAFGDGSATLMGLLNGKNKVPWNPRKSWAGLCAFLVVGTLMASMVYWISAQGTMTFPQTLACVLPVVAICGVLETLPLSINDNITIGCSAGILLVLFQRMTLGW